MKRVKMKLKKTALKVHLWLGIISSLFVFVICLSGSFFVFADELVQYRDKKIARVEAVGAHMDFEVLLKRVKIKYPKTKLFQSIIYKDKEKALLFVGMNKEKGLFYIYVNPYTGDIVGESRLISVFFMLAQFHRSLFLGKVGTYIVRISTIIFLIELITGIVIWWPKKPNKKYFRYSFTLKRKGSFVSRMIDVHRVLGLYFLAVMLLLSVTGIGLALNSGHAHSHGHTTNEESQQNKTPFALSKIINNLMDHEGVKAVKIQIWGMEHNPVIQVTAGTRIGIITYKGKTHLINRMTGQEVRDNGTLKKIEFSNTMRNLHTGSWLGWFGKIITFCSGLAGCIVTVTGVLIVLGKKVRPV
jgi:uncharacterized iron-regulated membrane protein